MRYFIGIFFLLIISLSLHAGKIYHHIPFNMSIHPGDAIIVDYDFSEKNGISCFAAPKKVDVNFTYKGRDKIEKLPITLQSDHIPKDSYETLADVGGQFSLTLDENSDSNQSVDVSCDYAS